MLNQLWRTHAWRFMPFLSARQHLENTRNHERRVRTDAAGLCPKCGSRHAADGEIVCRRCQSKRRGYAHKRRNRLLDAGLCVRCAKPRERPKVMHCNACIDKSAKQKRERKAA